MKDVASHKNAAPTGRRPLRHIIVCGSGRSGTTWVGDVLASCRRCFSLFEPLSPGGVPSALRWSSTSSGLPGPFVPKDEEHPEWKDWFDGLFSGRVIDEWMRQDWRRVPQVMQGVPFVNQLLYWRSRWLFNRNAACSETCIIKMIRGNLLLPWLASRFSLSYVYLIRNPCDVIHSRTRLQWDQGLQDVHAQPKLMEFLSPWKHMLAEANSAIEVAATLWCIENIIPLQMVESGDLDLYIYEDLVARPEETFGKLLSRAGLVATERTEVVAKQLVSSPMNAAGARQPRSAGLSGDDRLRVLDVCRGFGISLYEDTDGHAGIATRSRLLTRSGP